MVHEDRSRDDGDDAQRRSGAKTDPAPDESGKQPAEDPSELGDSDDAAEEDLESLRKLGRD